MTTKISVVLEDITKLQADAVANAANSSLLGGGGVDGAIHRACGPELLAACKRLGGCPTGEAKTTPAFGNMAKNGVKYIIHAVGPVWHGGTSNEAALLKSAYTAVLREACAVGAQSLALPAISCGVYGYPLDKATGIACDTVKAFIAAQPQAFSEIIFAVFSEPIYAEYVKHLN